MTDSSGSRIRRKLPAWMYAKDENKDKRCLAFSGLIKYCLSKDDICLACEEIISIADHKDELLLGFDAEWPVFPQGPGKIALLQICIDESLCLLFHVRHVQHLPRILINLIQHNKVKLVGNCIKNDLWKLGRDFEVHVSKVIGSGRVIDLGEYANRVLHCSQTWSLDRLALHLLAANVDKSPTVRMSRWDGELSSTQKLYAATDAYVVYVWNVGRIGFKPAYLLQKFLADRYKKFDGINCRHGMVKDTILLVEHNPVYTTGIRVKGYGAEEEGRLKALGADFFKTNRGGLITFHGPGQLVAYPIINLKNSKCSGLRSYVATIEEAVIQTCELLNIKAVRSPYTGVWVEDKKICAIGIHASRHITSHGLALNCNTDLNWFRHIVPCGIEGKGVTSISEELGKDTSISETIPHFLAGFSSAFQCQVEEYPDIDAKDILMKLNLMQ